MMCLGLFSLRTTSIVVVLATEAAIEGLLDKLLLLLLLGEVEGNPKFWQEEPKMEGP